MSGCDGREQLPNLVITDPQSARATWDRQTYKLTSSTPFDLREFEAQYHAPHDSVDDRTVPSNMLVWISRPQHTQPAETVEQAYENPAYRCSRP